MAKKKKKEVEVPKVEKPTETQYYWCVNCGNHGDYGSVKKRNLICELCKYDEITRYTIEEINDPDLDNITLDKFKKKGQKTVTEEHTEIMEAAEEAKVTLKQLDNKYGPIKKEKTVAEKLAEIRGMSK